jgi:replicative DNA helicase
VTDKITGSLQENLLTLLVFSPTAAPIIRNSVPEELYASHLFRDIIGRVYGHLDQFKRPPGDHFPDLIEDLRSSGKQKDLVEDIITNVVQLEAGVNEPYVLSQLEAFVRQQRLRAGINAAAESLQSGNLDRAEEVLDSALKARLDLFSVGVTLESSMTALKKGELVRDFTLTQIPELDKRQLGPARKEYHLFIAPAKKGKSWWLIHLAKHAVLQGWRVCYVTLELSDMMVAQRFLMSFFGVTRRKIGELRQTRLLLNADGTLQSIDTEELKNVLGLQERGDLKEIERRLRKMHQRKNLIIKEFPTRSLTMPALRAYLDSLERSQKFVPDLLVLDYADLMRVKMDNYRLELGGLTQELRGLAVERNIALATVSQSNREGARRGTVDSTHAAEDWSKIATADCVITYSQTKAEKRLDLARLTVTSGRMDADGFSILVAQNYATGQFALQSLMMRDTYWTQIGGSENEDEEEGAT